MNVDQIRQETITLLKDVEDFFPLILYRLNPRERAQCTQLGMRLEATREKLGGQQSTADDDLYLPMQPGNQVPGYVSVDSSGKASSGYTEVQHPEESDTGMYSYADPDCLKFIRPVAQDGKGEYVGVDRKEKEDGNGERETTKGQPGHANVVKDSGYIEVRGGKDESKDDGYIEFVSEDKGGGKAKKNKKGKKEQKKKASKIGTDAAAGDDEALSAEEDGDESQLKTGTLLSRMGAKVKGTLTGLSGRKGSQTDKPSASPSFRRKREEMKLRVEVSELANPTYEGLLQRRKHGISRGWEAGIWYILHNHTLYHCKSKDDEYATKDFPVFAYTVRPFVNKQQDPAFELSHPGVSTEVYKAETIEKRDKWIEALTAATQIEGLASVAVNNVESAEQEQDVYENADEPETEEQDVYENADDEPQNKMHPEATLEEPDVYENPDPPIAPKPPSQRRKVHKSSDAKLEKTYENVDIELYEDVEEEQYVYCAVKSHEATDDDELSFAIGDLILMDNMDDANWWVGTLQNKTTREFNGERGFVPKAYFVLKASSKS